MGEASLYFITRRATPTRLPGEGTKRLAPDQ